MTKIDEVKAQILDTMFPAKDCSSQGYSRLQQMRDYANSFDPLSGPNILRRSAEFFIDNGNGTMTIRPRQPFVVKAGE